MPVQRHDPVRAAHGRKARQHRRVMPGNDVLRPVRQFLDAAMAVQHPAHVEHDGKRPAGAQVVPVMRGIAGQHQPASLGRDAHHLQACRVPADQVQADAGRDLGIAVVEHQLAGMQPLDGLGHVPSLEGAAHRRVAHAATRAIRHFLFLQMQARLGKRGDIARVVVVHVGHDDVLDALGGDADLLEQIHRRGQIATPSPDSHVRREPGINQQGPGRIADHPHIEVQRHRGIVMRVLAQIVRRAAPLRVRGVSQCVDLIERVRRRAAHSITSRSLGACLSERDAPAGTMGNRRRRGDAVLLEEKRFSPNAGCNSSSQVASGSNRA